jgi:thiamine-monophosphate kinase
VSVSDGRVAITTDVLVENVHFRLDWSSPSDIGRKAVAVNLADIASMGAVSTGLVVGLACPRDTPVAWLTALSDGMWEEARIGGAGIVGGDTTMSDKIVISITALGDLRGLPPVLRSGARPGDVLAFAGRLGWAAAGLSALESGRPAPGAVVAAQRSPEPPYFAGPQAARLGATSMIDVSDGLLADVAHIARMSKVAIDVRSELVPLAAVLVEAGRMLNADPLRWALTGGEDHALAATFTEAEAVPDGWTMIGTVSDGEGVTVDGIRYDGPQGWEHFQEKQ